MIFGIEAEATQMVLMVSTLFFLIPVCECARILGIVSTPSYSHQIPFRPLWKELSLRGHQVTVLTTDPINDPTLGNLTEINLHGAYTVWNKRINMTVMTTSPVKSVMTINPITRYEHLNSVRQYLQDYQLSHPDVQKLINDESKQFDLLIIEPYARTMHAFAKKFNCPFIHILSLDAMFYNYDLIGNLAHPILLPELTHFLIAPVKFTKTIISILCFAYIKYFSLPRAQAAQEALTVKHFGPDYSDLQEITKNVSLLFVNNDDIFHSSMWLLPSIIQIPGGTHLKPLKPLPTSLQLELDQAEQGVIYWSFGSNVKSKGLSEKKRNIMLQVLSELPYLVLWKLELEDWPNKPDNVIVSKWFPQQDVLRHPNIKLFITQGDLQSLEETVYSGVPIVGIPLVGDQHPNVKRMTQKGIGVSLDYAALTKESFKEAILEVLGSSTYRLNVKELAESAQTKQANATHEAILWVEEVLRHRGILCSKKPRLDLPIPISLLFNSVAFSVFIVFSVIRLCVLIPILVPYKLIKCYLNYKQKVKSE